MKFFMLLEPEVRDTPAPRGGKQDLLGVGFSYSCAVEEGKGS